MRHATFIRSLNIETVPVVPGIEMHEYRPDVTLASLPDPSIDEYLIGDTTIDVRKAVPIHRLCKNRYNRSAPDGYWRSETFIAWSEEVEQLLGMPFNLLAKERETAIDQFSKYKRKVTSLTFWQRLKFAFTKTF